VHNDIKPDNILLDGDEKENLFPVISDFGIVYITDNADVVKGLSPKKMLGATLHYACPEIAALLHRKNNMTPTFYCDVYSFSIVMLEMMTRTPPWKSRGGFSVEKLLNGMRPNINFETAGKLEENMKILIETCWVENPFQRPSMEKIHEFLCDPKSDASLSLIKRK